VHSSDPDPAASAAAWLETVRFEDVMLPYSEWVGDWSDYHGNYAWQSLGGGDHRALSDCRAVVETLRAMVEPADASPWPEPTGPGWSRE
jgi:hypothetical protein